ncbi:cell division protein CrgA [Nocardioides sp. CER19]|uniref:cell division protein CrgA n=1 Tax=Nocardioides sp. CER19 TaxID=3038538 RepID=UPI00244CC496|nr:cell division protein CrgA [Nocardioides sp. CER19]MDH2412780.1 cell division protein CrgA [Nocardioides sp. CER19]
MPKLKPSKDFVDPTRGPVFSVRFIVSLILIVVGIAWIAYYYVAVRPGDDGKAGSPAFMADWGNWNYLIGFGLFFLGLFVSAHPSTPLGRGRGVVVGMLGCFLLGLAWICVFYIFSDDLSNLWVFNDLGQKNLVVGIAFMATGFAFATRWE